jgi:Cu/Ag efflux protein CusF
MEAKLTVDAVPAPEATFELTANNVEVQLPAETITIPVTVKNNSEVDATEVIINLWNNGVIATETIAELAAGAETIVNFTIDTLAAGTYSMQALTSDNKYGCYITVSVLAAPEEPVIDMAIEAIQGVSEIDVTQEKKVQVWYKNNGNVDLENVTINFSVNDHAQNAIVSVAAGKNGSVEFTIPTDIFEPNEDVEAELIAWVNIDDDIDNTNNRVSKTLPVSYGAAPEATFAVVAGNVTVEYGAESFNITATVTNTSDIDAEGVTVKLLKGATTVEEKALDLILPAGQSTTVTFTITATEEAPFTAGSTAKYYVQTGAAQAEVTVTFENAPVQPVIDMAIVDFRGLTQINLSQENKVQVWYQNNSNVDLDNVAIMFSVNDHAMEQSVNVKAGANGYVEFTIPTDIFEPTEDVEAELIAWVNVDGDIDTTNDRVTKFVPVVKGEDATAIKSIKAQFGENVQIFDLNGKKVNNVQKGVVYIVNGKKVVLK